jgi:hypothetical protein
MKRKGRLLLIILFSIFVLTVPPICGQTYYPFSQCTLTTVVNMPQAGYITPGTGLYTYGSTVYASVHTYSSYVFDGWYLNGVYQGKLTTIPITMTQDYTLIAVFSVRTVVLTINNYPSNGGATAPQSGIYNYTYGSSVIVREYPVEGATFSGWYLDGVYQGLGTSITVPMTQDRQLGAFYSGNIPTPTPSPQPSQTPAPTPTPSPTLPTPILSFYCQSSSTLTGYKVQISGALVYNNIGISGAGVALSYSANGGLSYNDLAYLITGDFGNFSAVWMPSSSGNYVVKGTWYGDDAYAPTNSKVNFAVLPAQNQNQNVFSVTSNSTISNLSFDSSHSSLGFTVSGTTGTSGFVQVNIPKSLLSVVSNLNVTLDGQNTVFISIDQGDSWLITIEYNHSTHSVLMVLDAPVATPTASPAPTDAATTAPTVAPTTLPTSAPTSTQTEIPTASPQPPSATSTPLPLESGSDITIIAVAAVAIVAIIAVSTVFVLTKRKNS